MGDCNYCCHQYDIKKFGENNVKLVKRKNSKKVDYYYKDLSTGEFKFVGTYYALSDHCVCDD